MGKSAKLKIQKWGNSLAVRIPSSVARQAGFRVGQPVRVSVQDSSVVLSSAGRPFLTLAQRLALFDPEQHAGAAMITERIGREVI